MVQRRSASATRESAEAGVERRGILSAALIGGAVAAVVVIAFALADRATLSDGLISRYIAANFGIEPGHVHPVVSSRGTSLRFGRVGLSALIWLFSAGRPGAMAWAQGAIMVASAAATSAAVRALLPRSRPVIGLVAFLALGFALSVASGYQDAPAMSFSVWAVVMASRERWWVCAGLLAAALLMRENAGAVWLGLMIWLAVHRRFRPMPVLATALVPVAIWYAYVASKYGHIPLFDPYLREATSTIRPPLIAVWQSLTRTSPASAVVAGIHVVLAAAAFRLWRSSIVGAVAAVAGLQVLMAGPFAYAFAGEAARAFAPLQLFLILAVLARLKHPPSKATVRSGHHR